MQKLSVVIITFNEERNITRCIKSVLSLADEVLVYDSFSTDATCAIAIDLGAKVIQQKWEGYTITKNKANALAANDWVLSLDADEALSDELSQSILELKMKGLCTSSFHRITNYCGQWIKYAGWYPDTKLRLFNRTEMCWQGLIHEELRRIDNFASKSKLLKGDCLHYSYYSIAEHSAQTEKFSTLSAQRLYQEGAKVNWIKIYVSPVIKFIQMYVFKLGFLEGKSGFTICWISAKASYLKYYKLKQLLQK